MNIISKYLFKKIIQKEVIQDFDHGDKITKLYEMIIEECRDQFCEDSKPTLDAYLSERHKDALGVKQ